MVLSTDSKWCAVYVAASCCANIGQGLVTTVVGPTQLYLAQNVGVDIDTINLVWTFGFFGYFLGAILAGCVFKRFFRGALAKVAFVGGMSAASGLMMCLLPFIGSFELLAVARITQYVALGAFITADASMLVYTMGPVKSRPFTNALHASVGVGFLTATFLVRPFLPDQDKAEQDREVICDLNGAGENGETEYEKEYLGGIDKIAWPFLLTGGWTLVCSVIYFVLGCLPLRMPRYYEEVGEYDSVPSSEPRIKHWKLVAVGVAVYYTLSCGIERIYQPMAYTYGLCGPLMLSPREAVATDSSYNGGFMTGRIVSIFLVKFVRPRNMIVASCALCVAAAVWLCALGGTDKYYLYTGTATLGFFVSWQFGSCYSWMAQKFDITGIMSSICFVGCGIGGVIFPR